MENFLKIFNSKSEYSGTTEGVANGHIISDSEIKKMYYIKYNGTAKCNDFSDDAFDQPVFSHTFKNGEGLIWFKEVPTEIGRHAFSGCSSMTSIVIPNSITSIGYWSFGYCSGLTSVILPNSITSIDNGAFYGCNSLASINLHNVETIGSHAFNRCYSLKSIAIPNSATELGESAFYLCSGLTSVTIGSGITSIGNATFSSCKNLKSIIIPDNVTSIGESFGGCSSLSSVTIGSGVTSIGGNAFAACVSLTNVEIPNNVTSIGNYAFVGCSGLTSVTIGSGATNMGGLVFDGCENLALIKSLATTAPTTTEYTFMNMPENGILLIPVESSGYDAWKTSLGDGWKKYVFGSQIIAKRDAHMPNTFKILGNPAAFSKVEVDGVELTTITTDYYFSTTGQHTIKYTLANETKIPDNAFSGANIYRFEIPYGVKEIGAYAFANSFTSSLVIPDSVTSIGEGAFYKCGSALTITISENIKELPNRSFEGCKWVSALTVPDSVEVIGDNVFLDCKDLYILRLGSNLKSIGINLFAANRPNDNKITYIFCTAMTAPTVQEKTFAYIKSSGTINVLSGSSGYDAWMNLLPTQWSLHNYS